MYLYMLKNNTETHKQDEKKLFNQKKNNEKKLYFLLLKFREWTRDLLYRAKDFCYERKEGM